MAVAAVILDLQKLRAVGAARLAKPGRLTVSIPNLITLGRILLVPGRRLGDHLRRACWLAFVLFLAAGVSDAVDGYLAKRFNMASELGAYLDPLADKTLIVSIYVTLGIAGKYSALAGHPGGVP